MRQCRRVQRQRKHNEQTSLGDVTRDSEHARSVAYFRVYAFNLWTRPPERNLSFCELGERRLSNKVTARQEEKKLLTSCLIPPRNKRGFTGEELACVTVSGPRPL